MIKNYEDILIIGHKGASAIAPENTLKAFKKAIELKANYVEFDIHKTLDGEIVIIHDADTFRVTGELKIIKNTTIRDLKKLDAGEGERIPTLKELIGVAKGKIGLQIEIKATAIAEDLTQILREEELVETAIISSFSFSELLSLKNFNPNLKLGYLLSSELKSRRLINRLTQKAIDNNLYAIHPHYNYVDDEFVNFSKDHNLKINVWTVNDRDVMQNLIEMGVDGIITDDIALAKELLGRN